MAAGFSVNKVSNTNDEQCRAGLEDVVFRCPSVFGRLWAVSELRDPVRDIYSHPLSTTFGQTAVDAALRRIHGEVFRSWLNFTLERQERDLWVWLNWLSRNSEDEPPVPKTVERRHRQMMPRDHHQAEAELFVADLELVFLVMRMAQQQNSGKGRTRQSGLGALLRPFRVFR